MPLIVYSEPRIIARGGMRKKKLPKAVDFDFVVDISPQFEKHVNSAMLRLQVLYPACRFACSDGGISIRGSSDLTEDQLRKDILHTVYREKIYAETLVAREALVAAVTSR